ncbi:hypothetical protein LTR93_010845 [Exophiala xenobiotica]|nr:hypothetical protein LTR93_010845 [Exophiala xenobiotica]
MPRFARSLGLSLQVTSSASAHSPGRPRHDMSRLSSWRRGAYAEAEKVQRKALERRERLLDPEDTDTLESCSNLQELLWDTGQYDEAEKIYRHAWKGNELESGKDDPLTLRNAAAEPAYL